VLTQIVNFVKRLLNLQTPVSSQPKPPTGAPISDPGVRVPPLKSDPLPGDPASSQVPEQWKADLIRFTKATSYLGTLGWDRLIVVTHAWHETGMFKHVIGDNNFFGITLPQGWTGKVCDVMTHEVYIYKLKEGETKDSVQAKAIEAAKAAWPSAVEALVIPSPDGQIWVRVKTSRKFADWSSSADALTFYANKIKSMYPQSFSFRNIPEKYFFWLVNGKYQYATDPQYIQACLNVYKEVQGSDLVKGALT
jgi:mannosyl-glycoprotein endo-beta-N-acetylglucosaminidase